MKPGARPLVRHDSDHSSARSVLVPLLRQRSRVMRSVTNHAMIVQEIKGRLHGHQPGLLRSSVSITTAAAGAALAAPQFAVAVWPALLAIIAFAALHGYYLWQGRLYRHLYADAVAGAVAYLSVDARPYKARERYWRALLSKTVLGLYLPLVVILLVVGMVTA